MTFWDSILHTAEDVTGFIGNHAGSILNAANAIATVAGAAKFEETVDDDGTNFVNTICENTDSAAKKVVAYTAKTYPEPVPATGNIVSGPYDLTGLWPNIVAQQNGEAPSAVAADVNKFLNKNLLPTSLGTGTAETDIGKSLANQMITLPDSSDPTFSSLGPLVVDAMADYGIKITGLHGYYPVPLGTGDTAWHANTRLYVETHEPTFHKKWAERKKSWALTRRPRLDDGQPYNQTTVKAVWASTKGSSDVMKAAVANMPSNYVLVPPSVSDGLTFTYQFQTTTDIGSGGVLTEFNTQITAALTAAGFSLTSMPQTWVTQQSTYIP
jgi:hypothetical protein